MEKYVDMNAHMKSTHAGAEDPDITVELLNEEAFSRYREPWNRLLDTSTSGSFFLKWEWMYTFWETIEKQDAELLVWLCYDGTELVGIAPLYRYSSTFMKIPVRKVAFLGDRVASDYMDFFAKPGYEEICCRKVLQRMRDQGSVAYDLLELNGVCVDSNLYGYLSAGSKQNKEIIMLPSFDCPRTLLAPSFDNYISRLSGSTRYALGRKQRRIERDFGATTIEHADLAQHPELLNVLFSLHKSRWDMLKDKTSTFYSAFRKSFNERLVRRLGEGDGFFSYVAVDGKPASILYILGYKNNAFFYQNGWDPKFADYSIGIYNIQQAIRHAIAAGYKSFDFLRGEEAYKYKFCEDARQAYSVLLFGKGLPGRVIKTLFLLKHRLKKLLQRRMRGQRPGIRKSMLHSCFLQDQRS